MIDGVELGASLYDAQSKRHSAMGPLSFVAAGARMDSKEYKLSLNAGKELDKAVLRIAKEYLKTAVGQAEWDYVVNGVGGPEGEPDDE